MVTPQGRLVKVVDGARNKIRRRHRADLSGFTIVVPARDGMPLAESAYRALAEEFRQWLRRTGRLPRPEQAKE